MKKRLKTNRLTLALGMLFLILPAALQAADSGRRIGVGDQLVIHVLGEKEMDAPRRVPEDGVINYFFVGDVKVLGKTTAEVEKELKELLDRDYLVNPQVIVEIEKYDEQYVSVAGQVGRPGRVALPPDHSVDVIEAIAQAGDFTRLAKKSDIKLRRAKTGEVKRYTYDELQKNIQAGKKIVVEPGDVITVGERVF
jgi:polysaccharide export outer membrane protein